MAENINIPAIHDDDLKLLLIKHGLYEKILKGKVYCYMSDEVITWDNIYGIFEVNGEIKIVCDSVDCIDKLSKS
ncbi:hypothetical protein JN11_03929 [Mucilaginibacter frigoritolerans]|uniref:Uncharacterized protein n=1 Tax=Mucilaginibacter frigoritolerans TaxID=652788 RepID=A0A562TUN4_9SPHI|nr:hypothetical protein [Mucilaginibacter frigoritolerans]TWI96816.1 hypothetical protein JN11_03929 [Mucilaginibacter frigoritolerans]